MSKKLPREKLDSLIKSMKKSINDWNYYVDFSKVYSNLKKFFEKDLEILNSLIGSKDIENDFRRLIRKNPGVLKLIPILLGTRNKEIIIYKDENVDKDYFYKFEDIKSISKVEEENYVTLMKKTGLFDFFKKRVISNLLDYLVGIEAGLNSNARKNRTGKKWKK
nr:DpnII family type II restriction endonuclease [Metamycoplasma alkalescens]